MIASSAAESTSPFSVSSDSSARTPKLGIGKRPRFVRAVMAMIGGHCEFRYPPNSPIVSQAARPEPSSARV